MTAPKLIPILTVALTLAACGEPAAPVRCEPERDVPRPVLPDGCPLAGDREDAPVVRTAPEAPPKPEPDPAPDPKPDPKPAPDPKPGWGHGDKNHHHHHNPPDHAHK